MREWRRGGLLALGGLALLLAGLLAGCAEQPPAAISPADAVALLRTGRPLLNCRDACVAEWRAAQPQAAQLDQAGRWTELAALVVRIGYQDDLALYYLGRAAEGLGYPGAASSYYRQSTYLSGTANACGQLSRLCGGVILPRAASSRLAAIDRDLNRQRRPGPPLPRGAAPAAGPAASPSEIGSPEIGSRLSREPATSAANAPGAPGPSDPPMAIPSAAPSALGQPVADTARQPPSDYIEPPPAAR